MYDGGLDGTCWFCSALKGLSSWRRAYAHSLDLVREGARESECERERERERMNGSESVRERSQGKEEEEEEEGLMHAGE